MRSFSRTILSITLILGTSAPACAANSQGSIYVPPSDCKNLEIIFARGTDENINGNNFQAFRSSVEKVLSSTKYTYHFYELGSSTQNGYQYPASSPDSLIGTYLSAGTAYRFGRSVEQGINELKSHISSVSTSCPHTKFILSGYSQGADIMGRAISNISAEKIVYVANLGDPKTYLPEGEGLFPPACRNQNLSPWRANVEDCKVSSGLLGARKPYQPESYSGKLGLWCNKNDFICGSSFVFTNLFGGHTSYIEKGRYDEIANTILTKVRKTNFSTSSSSALSPTGTPAPENKHLIIFVDQSLPFKGIETQLISAIISHHLSEDDDILIFPYGTPGNQLLSYETLTQNPFFSSRIQHLHLRPSSSTLAAAAHSAYQTYDKYPNLNYGVNPCFAKITSSSSFDFVSGDEFLNIVNSFVFNQNQRAASLQPNSSSIVSFQSNTPAFTASLRSGSPISAILATNQQTITIVDTEITDSTLKIKLALPDNSTGTVLLLNNALVGIASSAELGKSDNVVTISDLDLSQENILIIKSIDNSGHPSESAELNLDLISTAETPAKTSSTTSPATPPTAPTESTSPTSTTAPTEPTSPTTPTSPTKNFPPVHVPDCGDARKIQQESSLR